MKIEVRCPDCGNAWLVDERSRRGEMLCPRCMSRIPLDPTGEATADRPAAEMAVELPTVADADRPAAGPALVSAPPPGAIVAATENRQLAEAVCPRCKLHFQLNPDAPSEIAERRWDVLVVDDLEYFRRLAAESLGSRFQVKTASNRQEAMAAAGSGSFDLIVLDLTLDGGDGGRQLLRDLRPKPCPILIFTAQDESDLYGDYWQELTQLGADDLVIKGMKVGESLLRKALELVGAPLDEDHSIS